MIAKLTLIALCLAIGVVLKQLNILADVLSVRLNQWVIWAAYPAIVLIKIPELLADPQLGLHKFIPFSMPILNFIMAFAAITLFAKRTGLSRGETGALILTTGLGNTSFVGFPLVEAYFGEDGLQTALLIDQGTFLSMAFIGIPVAAQFSGTRLTVKQILARVLLFPPFVALAIAIALTLLGKDTWRHIPLLKAIGSTLAPAALIAIGLRLKGSLEHIPHHKRALFMGLSLKLIILPLVLTAIYWLLIKETPVFHVLALETAMAPMITAAIIAEQYHLKRDLSQLMVSVGIPISLVTTFIWQVLLKQL